MTDDRSWRKDVPTYKELEPEALKDPGINQVFDMVKPQPEENFQQLGGYSHISTDQFQNLIEQHPETEALQTLHQLKNHFIFLFNTTAGLRTSAAAKTLVPTTTVLANYDSIMDGHMSGEHQKVSKTLGAMHNMFQETLKDPSINQKAVLESPMGMHLKDMADNIIPNTIQKYKDLTESD